MAIIKFYLSPHAGQASISLAHLRDHNLSEKEDKFVTLLKRPNTYIQVVVKETKRIVFNGTIEEFEQTPWVRSINEAHIGDRYLVPVVPPDDI